MRRRTEKAVDMRILVALEDDYRAYREVIALSGFPVRPCNAAVATSALQRSY